MGRKSTAQKIEEARKLALVREAKTEIKKAWDGHALRVYGMRHDHVDNMKRIEEEYQEKKRAEINRFESTYRPYLKMVTDEEEDIMRKYRELGMTTDFYWANQDLFIVENTTR